MHAYIQANHFLIFLPSYRPSLLCSKAYLLFLPKFPIILNHIAISSHIILLSMTLMTTMRMVIIISTREQDITM